MGYSAIDGGLTRPLPGPSEAGADRPRRRITVVDDSEEFVAIISDLFAEQYDVTAANVAAIHELASTRPDVLIIDLHLGEDDRITGWELLTLARRHEDLRAVPIIVCTADLIALKTDGGRLAQYDDVHVLTKPFGLDDIEGLVRRLVPSPAR